MTTKVFRNCECYRFVDCKIWIIFSTFETTSRIARLKKPNPPYRSKTRPWQRHSFQKLREAYFFVPLNLFFCAGQHSTKFILIKPVPGTNFAFWWVMPWRKVPACLPFLFVVVSCVNRFCRHETPLFRHSWVQRSFFGLPFESGGLKGRNIDSSGTNSSLI